MYSPKSVKSNKQKKTYVASFVDNLRGDPLETSRRFSPKNPMDFGIGTSNHVITIYNIYIYIYCTQTRMTPTRIYVKRMISGR